MIVSIYSNDKTTHSTNNGNNQPSFQFKHESYTQFSYFVSLKPWQGIVAQIGLFGEFMSMNGIALVYPHVIHSEISIAPSLFLFYESSFLHKFFLSFVFITYFYTSHLLACSQYFTTQVFLFSVCFLHISILFSDPLLNKLHCLVNQTQKEATTTSHSHPDVLSRYRCLPSVGVLRISQQC